MRDRLDRRRPALGLADHRDQAGLAEHHLGELVHARRGGRAGGADDLVAHRIDRADVVDDAVGEVDRQRLRPWRACPAMRLCAASRPVSILPLSSSVSPGFQLATSSRRQRVEVDAPCASWRRAPSHVGPVVEARRLELGRARAVEHEMRVARRGAVRDHRHRLGRRMRRVLVDLDVEHGGQAAQALRADAERVDLVVRARCAAPRSCSAGRAPCSSCMSIGSISASLASSIAFSAVPPMPMPSMPGGHQPAPIVGTVFSTQSTMRSRRIQHHELGLVLASRRPWPRPSRRPCRRARARMWITAGVLSLRVLARRTCGSATIEARSLLSGWR